MPAANAPSIQWTYALGYPSSERRIPRPIFKRRPYRVAPVVEKPTAVRELVHTAAKSTAQALQVNFWRIDHATGHSAAFIPDRFSYKRCPDLKSHRAWARHHFNRASYLLG